MGSDARPWGAILAALGRSDAQQGIQSALWHTARWMGSFPTAAARNRNSESLQASRRKARQRDEGKEQMEGPATVPASGSRSRTSANGMRQAKRSG